jgi:tRNA threonylcarbamoyl adenosine modification protein YeaZ/ribosomal-protein-alanine acetyltransferase
MKVLAIDSSGLTATVALVDEDITIATYTINHKKTHSVTLLPMIEEILTRAQIELDSLDGIVMSGGPGSFTGLRIGTATGKGLGLATNKPLIKVPTIEGMAYQVYGFEGLICPIMDARRNQVYTGLYTFQRDGDDFSFKVVKDQFAVTIDELIKELNQREELSHQTNPRDEKGSRQTPVMFLGDGVPVHKEQLKEQLERTPYFAPSFLNRQNAAALGALGIQYLKEGRTVTAKEFKPEYLRVAQAERELEASQKDSKLEIRISEPEDIPTILELERENFTDPWTVASITDTLNQPYNLCLTAQKAGKVVGYLFATLVDKGEILAISVSKGMKRQGVGGKLIQELAKIAIERNIQQLILDVRESNQEAILFYQKMGFEKDGIRPGYYNDPKEDGILMSLSGLPQSYGSTSDK